MSAGQMHPVGPEPEVAEMLVGALMYSSPTEAATVLALVHHDDIDPPLNIVLKAIRALVSRDVLPSPQLTLDELKRTGLLTRQVATALMSATTTGASAAAARYYAAAVVAESLRRHVESAGNAFTTAASTASEGDLEPMVRNAVISVLDCAGRLKGLRGDFS
jgi:replicative DNA helicase